MTPGLTTIMQPILAAVGAIIAALIYAYAPKAIAALEARAGIQLTDQQRAAVIGAVQTAAGVIETKLDQGALQVAHVTASNPAIRDEARTAINAVPTASAALGMTVDGVARMIVGATDTAVHGVTTAVSVTPATDEVTTTTVTQGAP